LAKHKKSRRKKLIIWLLVDFTVAALVFGLLLYKPSMYNPIAPPAVNPDGERVHPYLSHDLMPTLYNGAQDRRPFELVVLDGKLNEAIAQSGWLQESGGIILSAPEVLFAPGRIILMGTADVQGAGFVITIELGPQLNADGLLNINVEKVKIGAMNITVLAKIMGKKMYRDRLEAGPVDTEDLRTQIVASLLNEEPFDPVFLVDDKWVRLTGVEITQGRLIAQLVPVR